MRRFGAPWSLTSFEDTSVVVGLPLLGNPVQGSTLHSVWLCMPSPPDFCFLSADRVPTQNRRCAARWTLASAYRSSQRPVWGLGFQAPGVYVRRRVSCYGRSHIWCDTFVTNEPGSAYATIDKRLRRTTCARVFTRHERDDSLYGRSLVGFAQESSLPGCFLDLSSAPPN